ncbi:uncharacterized protein LOC135706387 [Ochlerotatus camptorhynchus]|uniref:uncharacterized protein LOC135706387 n=1 Tax=Ochlerotatus camptorhynchus TaxID=644619 RepID=UPI0031CE422A
MESNKKTVKVLRDELAALGAKRTGNKKVLEKRLENWNKHNLNSTLVAVPPVPAADSSAFENMKKYNAMEDLPTEQLKWLTFETIKQYFQQHNALNSFKEGRKLHVANHLRQVGFGKTSAGGLQVRSFCKAAMKKQVLYCVIVELAIASISKCTCTCPAGQGNSAACKHVAALLLCLECYLETGTIFTGASCTSELQQWHKPPKLEDEQINKHNFTTTTTGSSSSSRKAAVPVNHEFAPRTLRVVHAELAAGSEPRLMVQALRCGST